MILRCPECGKIKGASHRCKPHAGEAVSSSPDVPEWKLRIAGRRAAERVNWSEHLSLMDERKHDAARRLERDLFGIKGEPMSEETKAVLRARTAGKREKDRQEKEKAKAMGFSLRGGVYHAKKK